MSTEDAWQKQAAQQIKAIQPADTGTSKAARIRALLPDIEDAMQRGVSQTDLLATLASTGLVMTLDELRNALYRARQRLKRASKPYEAPAIPPPAPAPQTPALGSSEAGQQNTPSASTFDWPTLRDTKPNW
ncbi:MAG: hypothetical protein HYZ18_13910 [Pseudogulbenkiania sp.]|nr:hypothetical protein [Pseudogulbenkiania sp.]